MASLYRYPAMRFPYLGIWVDEMGYADKPTACIAPEPCTGALDSIALADAFGKVAQLPPSSASDWQLCMEFKAD